MTTIADEIDRLAAQRAAGHLSEVEFEAAKARLFAQAPDAATARLAGPTDRLQRLRRSLNDRWIGGVCGGIAQFTGVESWLVRLAFTLAILFAGVGLIPYVVLWIFIPPEGR